MRTGLSSLEESWTHAAQLNSLRAGPAAASAGDAYESSMAVERFLCEACGDTIGVYEPMVMRTTESERVSSRAAEPELRPRDGAYFHRKCREASAG
ncbi:MAG TPA: hypothetical protein VIJ50_10495 [Solirubrobacteraceae bacterium]